MKNRVEIIPEGTVTSPKGFQAGAISAGIKKGEGALDLGMLSSTVLAVVAGVFTTNQIKAAPVVLSQERIQSGKALAVVVNSGCANACTGEAGLADAQLMTELAARRVGVPVEKVLVASTGVIGQRLPMELVRCGMERITLSPQGGHTLVRAMMTTDTVPKEIAVRCNGQFTIGGVAKGAGMIHPNMATMICFLATDAAVELDFMRKVLKKAVDLSFNMISVDGDTSTNDTVIMLANGLAHNTPISAGSTGARVFQQALNQVCVHLAKSIVHDGEGATKLIEVNVSGAKNTATARHIARMITTSPLVKTAVYGADPNWGRILAVVGRNGTGIVESRVDISIGDVSLVKGGLAVPFGVQQVRTLLQNKEVSLNINLNMGSGKATAWGCDLTAQYVEINSHYTT